jgi:hypothetical protein
MRIISLAVIASAAAAAPAPAQTVPSETAQAPAVEDFSGPAIEFSTGLTYEEGEYGTGEKVRTLTVPAALRAQVGQVQFSASLPWMRIDAPANVVGGGGLLGLPIIIDPTQPETRERRSGIGDLRLGAAWTLPGDAVGLTLSSQVKVPTASTRKGLGTGELDYGVGAELSKRIGAIIPFVGVGYTVAGDPADYGLRNSLSVRAGSAFQVAPTARAHVAWGYARSLSPLVPNEQQVAAGLNASVSRRLNLGVFGAAGLSQGSPDLSAGLQLGFRLR